MKKTISRIFIVFLVGLFSLACSNDDDNESKNELKPEETIIGNWELRNREPDGIDICEFSSYFSFLDNRTINGEVYAGDEPSECASINISGSWEFVGGSKFIIQIDGKPDVVEVEINFPNNNTMEMSSQKEGYSEFYARKK